MFLFRRGATASEIAPAFSSTFSFRFGSSVNFDSSTSLWRCFRNIGHHLTRYHLIYFRRLTNIFPKIRFIPFAVHRLVTWSQDHVIRDFLREILISHFFHGASHEKIPKHDCTHFRSHCNTCYNHRSSCLVSGYESTHSPLDLRYLSRSEHTKRNGTVVGNTLCTVTHRSSSLQSTCANIWWD